MSAMRVQLHCAQRHSSSSRGILFSMDAHCFRGTCGAAAGGVGDAIWTLRILQDERGTQPRMVVMVVEKTPGAKRRRKRS